MSAQSSHINPLTESHAADAMSVTEALNVEPSRGLIESEAKERLAKFGANELQSIRPRSAWRILVDQFLSLIVALLAFAAIIAWATGDHIEAVAILVVLALNALIGFAVEWQANRALDALRKQARTVARVRRDGYEMAIDAAELVPGDIVILNAGDRVPADARLVEAAALRSEESALTGESAVVEKSSAAVARESLLAERHSMLYLGTTVAAGRAVAVITATGTGTELGKIGRLVADAVNEPTPLERRLEELGRRLVYLVLLVAAVVIVAGLSRGEKPWMMVEVGISLAVAAVPEGLPAVTTLILALGVLRMARRKAVVRRLPAVETLGSTTVICCDKTGTLTQNRMTVREIRLADGKVIELGGARANVGNDELLRRAVRAGVLCNEAVIAPRATDDSQNMGDPTEIALLTAARGLGVDAQRERELYPKTVEIPFDSAMKRMITAHRAPDGSRFAFLKGAARVALGLCSNYVADEDRALPLDDESRARLLAVNDEMADRALRVLALAEKRIDESEDDLESGYTFLGFAGMIDPPRAEAAESIRQARGAGIRVVMLTGDQVNTARAIARELRLSGDAEPRVLHARDLEAADQKRIAELAGKTDVFARVSPEDKLRIVEALQQAGEIVAVTGDGVNDAPALKRADIGVAMGQRGTEAAKEAADVVLADDNFATIVRAVAGGRTIYSNIIKFVHMMFSHNLGEVITIFVAILIGWPLPLLPLQILWVNLVTDVFPAMALAVEPGSKETMQRPPRSPKEPLLSRRFVFLIVWQATMLAVITLVAYWWALGAYGAGSHARTIALVALIGVQLGHFFNCRSRTRSAFEGLFRNPFIWAATAIVIGLQLMAIYWSAVANVLDTVPLNREDWYVIGFATIAPIVIVEITKLARFIRLRRHAPSA